MQVRPYFSYNSRAKFGRNLIIEFKLKRITSSEELAPRDIFCFEEYRFQNCRNIKIFRTHVVDNMLMNTERGNIEDTSISN